MDADIRARDRAAILDPDREREAQAARCRVGEHGPCELAACVPVFVPPADSCLPRDGFIAVHYGSCDGCGELVWLECCPVGGWQRGDDPIVQPFSPTTDEPRFKGARCGARPGVLLDDLGRDWPHGIFDNPAVWMRERPSFGRRRTRFA